MAGSEGVVVVTGASTGIGRATALDLADAGYEVFAGVRRKADGDALRKDAKVGGGRLRALTLDVTKPRTIETAKTAVQRRAGRRGLKALVNNAGIAVAGPLEYIPLEEFRRQMEVNLTGQLAVTQAFLPMLRKGKGRIVNVASIGGRMAFPFNGPYHASKWGLEALSDALRLEVQPWGVEVIVVEPGSVATEIWRRGTRQANKLRKTLPREAEKLYGKAMDAIENATQESADRAMPPEKAAAAIRRAITSNRPKLRYQVGRDAKAMLTAKRVLTPRRWDRVVTSQTGVPEARDRQVDPGGRCPCPAAPPGQAGSAPGALAAPYARRRRYRHHEVGAASATRTAWAAARARADAAGATGPTFRGELPAGFECLLELLAVLLGGPAAGLRRLDALFLHAVAELAHLLLLLLELLAEVLRELVLALIERRLELFRVRWLALAGLAHLAADALVEALECLSVGIGEVIPSERHGDTGRRPARPLRPTDLAGTVVGCRVADAEAGRDHEHADARGADEQPSRRRSHRISNHMSHLCSFELIPGLTRLALHEARRA